jgi:cell division GTPase FtsZ
MKLLVIGCGQCGGRISDEFARLNRRSRSERDLDVITSVIAVNTDVADLSGLSNVKKDPVHRLMIGAERAGGHGVGKINELGADIARHDGDKIVEAISGTGAMAESDAVLVIAGAAGGTGSGAMPVITRLIKEHFPGKVVYNMAVLPFQHEEQTEARTIFNVATCLKSVYLVADAVFLVDNQRYAKEENTVRANMGDINTKVVEPFYNLLCADEERHPDHIGGKVIDSGDIMETLSGWTVFGFGRSAKIGGRPFGLGGLKQDFKEKRDDTEIGTRALKLAIDELSVKCDTEQAQRALYLLTAPSKAMNLSLIKDMASSIQKMAPKAMIRGGDYPRSRNSIEVTLILSDLASVSLVKHYFDRVLAKPEDTRGKGAGIYEVKVHGKFEDIPVLI